MLGVTGLLTVVLLAAIAVSFTAALLAWRERPEPGATPLVVLLSGAIWWSAFLVFELRADTLAAKALWSNVQWVGVVAIPLAWLWFALEYTGRDEYVRVPVMSGLAVIPVLTVVLALTNPYHNLLYLDARLVEQGGLVLLERTPGPAYWLIAVYTYLLGAAGMVPLFNLIRSDALPFRGQSVALLLGIVAPWGTNILYLTGIFDVPGLDPTPIAFSITGLAFLGALTQFRLFGTSPAPNFRARHLVFDRMADGAVVVDSHDVVVDVNESAEDLLGFERTDALGRDMVELLPSRLQEVDATEPGDFLTVGTPHGERPFDVSVTRISDVHDRLIGRVFTFHDVSEYVRQQQRLEVLNRVFRHNIRTETQMIIGYAERLTDTENDDTAEILKDRAVEIAAIGDKARTIIDLFEQHRGPERTAPLREMIETGASRIRSEQPDVTIRIPSVPEDLVVSSVLGPVITNVLENAAVHNTNQDPHVDVHVDPGSERVRIRIADNGPGLDANEYGVLERGSETPLDHASGLGLWLIYWGTEIAGGSVSFQTNGSSGSIVTLDVPRLD